MFSGVRTSSTSIPARPSALHDEVVASLVLRQRERQALVLIHLDGVDHRGVLRCLAGCAFLSALAGCRNHR